MQKQREVKNLLFRKMYEVQTWQMCINKAQSEDSLVVKQYGIGTFLWYK
jgi:hypothetical protein